MRIAMICMEALIVAAATVSSYVWCGLVGKTVFDRVMMIVVGPVCALWFFRIWSPPVSDYAILGLFGSIFLIDVVRIRRLRHRAKFPPVVK